MQVRILSTAPEREKKMTTIPKFHFVHPDGRTIVATWVQFEQRYRDEGFVPLEDVLETYVRDDKIEKVTS